MLTDNPWSRTQQRELASHRFIHNKHLEEGEVTEPWSNLGKADEVGKTGSGSIRDEVVDEMVFKDKAEHPNCVSQWLSIDL